MLPRMILTVGFTLSVVASAFAEPAKVLWNGTGSGGVLVPGAEIRKKQLSVTGFGSYLSEGGLVSPGDEVTRSRFGVGALYAPLESVEIGGHVAGSSTTNSLGNPENLTAFGDAVLTAKGAYQVNDFFTTGLRGELRLYSGIAGESGYGDTASYAIEWVATTRTGNLAAHLMAGFLYDRTVNFTARPPTAIERFAWNQNDFNQALYGLSLNYETGFADYTLELSGEAPVGSGSPAFSDSPLRATPGVRLRPWGPLELLLAGNIALTNVPVADRAAMAIPAQPGLDILGAIRWHFDAALKAEPVAEEPAAQPAEEPAPAPAPQTEVTPPAAAAPAQLGALVGRIVNMATGGPVENATVTLLSTGATFTASSTGNFVIPNLPLGPVTIRVDAPGMQSNTVAGEIKSAGLNSLDVGLQSIIVTATLQVLVLDKSGQPLPGAEVLVDGKPAGTTDAEGRATLTDIAAGTREIVARKTGYQAGTAAFIEFVAGQTVTETLTLSPELRPGFVEIKVVDEERQPVAAVVTVEGQPDMKRVLDPAAGSTVTLKVTPGTYKVQVEAPGYQSETQEVTVPEDGELALRFKLKR